MPAGLGDADLGSAPERVDYVVERVIDLRAKLAQHDDDDDRNEYEDQRVLHQALSAPAGKQSSQRTAPPQHAQVDLLFNLFQLMNAAATRVGSAG